MKQKKTGYYVTIFCPHNKWTAFLTFTEYDLEVGNFTFDYTIAEVFSSIAQAQWAVDDYKSKFKDQYKIFIDRAEIFHFNQLVAI